MPPFLIVAAVMALLILSPVFLAVAMVTLDAVRVLLGGRRR
jgi:hypothetical protein